MNQHCADKYADQWDVKGFNRAFESVFGKVPNEKWYEEELKADEHAEIFYKWIEDLYKEKIDFFRKVAAFNFEPEEGKLLIFPSYLYHSVKANKSNEDRIVISFNVEIYR